MGQEKNGKLWKLLAFHVHTDHNPEKVKLAGERMAAVMDNKNNEAYLLMLAKRWGIELPPEYQNYKPQETKTENVKYRYGFPVLYTGSYVDVLFNTKSDKVAFSGYIVDFKKNNVTENVLVYIVKSNGIIKIIYVNYASINILRSNPNHTVVYTEYYTARNIYMDYVAKEKEKEKKQKAKEKREEYKKMFKKVGLKPNKEYKYDGLSMEYNGVTYRVVKTTTNKVVLSYMGILTKIRIEDATRVKY